MTDFIYLPVHYTDDMGNVADEHVEITPELARQIVQVALATGNCMPAYTGPGMSDLQRAAVAADKPAPPTGDPEFAKIAESVAKQMPATGWTVADQPAGDDAAVELRVINEVRHQCKVLNETIADLRAKLDAIKTLISEGDDPDETAMLEAEGLIPTDAVEQVKNVMANCRNAEAERDRLAARVAELERERGATKGLMLQQAEHDAFADRVRADAAEAERDKALADLAAMTGRAEKAERGLAAVDHARLHALEGRLRIAERDAKEWEQSACDYNDVVKQRDAARAEAAQWKSSSDAWETKWNDVTERAEAELKHANEWSRKVHEARADADALRSELMEERNHREKGESIMRELTKQRDALKARKVTYEAISQDEGAEIWNHPGSARDCVLALYSAGVEVE